MSKCTPEELFGDERTVRVMAEIYQRARKHERQAIVTVPVLPNVPERSAVYCEVTAKRPW